MVEFFAYGKVQPGVGKWGNASAGEPSTRTERVQFPRGSFKTVLGGHLNGGDAVNYLLRAREGQFLTVSLLPNSPNTQEPNLRNHVFLLYLF